MRFFDLFRKQKSVEPLETSDLIIVEEEPDYVDKSDSKLKGFDWALAAIKDRDYAKAEQILNANDCKPAINHTEYESYNEFFEYEIAWPESVAISDEEIKAMMILYYLYNTLGVETIAKDLKERTGIDIDTNMIRKIKRTIQSLDEIISGKELANSLKGGSSRLKCFYVIKSMKDGRVCKHCKKLEGKKYLYKNAVIGVNYPPFDHCENEYCRCIALSKLE